jgi:branched-chain amino acid transport system substrate-binding protein
MKKLLWIIILIVVLAVVVVLANGRENSGSSNETIHVGALLPLSGAAAYYGEQSKKGIEIAVAEMEAETDLDIEVVYEDNLFTAKGAVDAYNKIKNTQQIDAVITASSPAAMGVAPLSQQDNILQMAIFANVDAYSSPNDLRFRTSTLSGLEMQKLAEFVQKYSKVAMLYVNNDFGVSTKNSFTAEMQKRGVQTTAEGYATDAGDFRSQLVRIKQFAPGAVVIVGPAKQTGIALKQAKEIGLQAQFLSTRAAEDPVLLQSADVAEGLIYPYPFDAENNAAQIRKFTQTFRDTYDTEPDAYSAEAYEGLRLIARAFAECGKNHECIQQYLTNLRDYPSIFGPVSFDQNGDISYEYFYKTIRNGAFMKY